MGLYENMIIPWLTDTTEPKEMAEQRRLLLNDVRGEILEIGIGTGVNLDYYPPDVKSLTCVEPSDGMRKRASKKAVANGQKIEWHKGLGEQLPFCEERFDSVVCTDVLCTVINVDEVLKEAYRVLKPGGRFYFLEHGISIEDNIKKWQIRLNGFSKLIACGCNLTRDLEKHIRDSNFFVDELIIVPPFSGMNVLYTHIRGVAIK
jgi:ubiquinone/menaquinone biosynthesis C-methylase UbiE